MTPNRDYKYCRTETNVAVIRYLGGLFVLGLLAGQASAVVFDPALGSPVSELQVPLNQSRILILSHPIESLSVGNPKVADVVVLESNKFYVVGKSLGTTNVVLWGRGDAGSNGLHNTFKVEVTYDLDTLKKTIHDLMPDENPEVHHAPGGIVLGGQVSSPAKIDAIVALAKQFVKNFSGFSEVKAKENTGAVGTQDITADREPGVINMMQVGGPQQVMLEVKVAEVSRKVLKQLGVNLAALDPGKPWTFGAVNGGASFPNALNSDGDEVAIFPRNGDWQQAGVIGPPVDKFDPTTPSIAATGLLINFLTGGSLVNMVIDASREDGVGKILAEPTLTTLSGEPAEFLSGGEFPIPVWSGDSDRIVIVFKEFGVGVKFLPTVLDTNKINLNLNISVSELTDAASIASGVPTASVSFAIPSLSTRKASSTVELADGQTIGIAGLISDKLRENTTKFPGLGDIPILGSLFRSQSYISEQSELIMFVTPHLAKPHDKTKMRLPTDSFTTPSDAEFFLLGRMTGKTKPDSKNPMRDAVTLPAESPKQPPQQSGPGFGHTL